MKINHPAPGDVVSNPAQVAGYGTAFEGVISVRIRDETTGP
jgi:Immunoglobulin-like domain of bacterial spore germination